MLSAVQLREQIQAYVLGRISLGGFEDWFYEQSIDVPDQDVAELVAAVDAALSAWHFEKLKQKELRAQLQELANTVRPFASSEVADVSVSYKFVPTQNEIPKYSGVLVTAAVVLALTVSTQMTGERVGSVGGSFRQTASASSSIRVVAAEAAV